MWKCLTLCVMEEINKQQQFFLSEYHLQEINSREIYPHSTFSSKRSKCTKVWKNANSFSGFAQIESWILEKVLKFAQQFSRPGKRLVNGDEEKFIFVFVPKFESWEKLCSCFSWGLYWSPILITLSLEKKNCCFGKKVLIFGSKNQFTNPDFKSDVLAAVTIFEA